jgi:HEAT repeat protein
LVTASFIAAVGLIGCSSQSQDQRLAIEAAHSGLNKYRSKYDAGWGAPRRAEICQWFAPATRDPETAARTIAYLLQDNDTTVRVDCAYLLGYLDVKWAREPLRAALTDPEQRVRVAACRTLGWISPGEAAEPILAQLCRDDRSLDVRIAAAIALARGDDDAIAAFRQGLLHDFHRETCEDALERQGKLELPLPDQVYTTVSRAEYERWLKSGQVCRETTKDGAIYFEVIERRGVRGPPGVECALGSVRNWYRTREKW